MEQTIDAIPRTIRKKAKSAWDLRLEEGIYLTIANILRAKPDWSDEAVAELVNVSKNVVNKIRLSLNNRHSNGNGE